MKVEFVCKLGVAVRLGWRFAWETRYTICLTTFAIVGYSHYPLLSPEADALTWSTTTSRHFGGLHHVAADLVLRNDN
jgi:hypothetical protein